MRPKSDTASMSTNATVDTPNAEPAASSSPPLRAGLYYIPPADPVEAKAALDALRAFAIRSGYVPVVTYAERDPSACPTLKKLMKRAKARGVDVVCVPRLDDLAISRAKVARLVIEIGICVASASGVSLNPADPVVRWLAAENRQRAAQIKRALDAKRAGGQRVGQLPYGATVGNDGVTLVDDPNQMRLLRLAQQLAAGGDSTAWIAHALREEGFTTTIGTPITTRFVRRILKRYPPR